MEFPSQLPGIRSPARLLHATLIVLVALAAFSASFRNGFIFDDRPYIVNNPVLESTDGVGAVLTSDDAVGSGTRNPYYRPLTTLTFLFDRVLHGSSPFGYHATNVVLHLSVCLLLYFAAARITDKPHSAFLAALFFAIHPAHAEPVAYISARADLMCGLGMTAALLLHLRWRETGSRAALAASAAAFAVAAFSKIVAIAFPALLALHAGFLDPKARRWREAILPYAAVAVAFLVIRQSVLEMTTWEAGPVPLEIRFANAGVFLVKYLRNALFPFGLRLFYDYPIRASFLEPIVLSAWSTLAALALFSVSAARRQPAALFGLAWFFACLAPVAGFVMILYPAPMADRYMYVPLIGMALASTALFDRIRPEAIRLRTHPARAGVILVVAVGMIATTASRVTAWREPLQYWKRAAADNPGSIHVLAGLGQGYLEAGRVDEAERAYEQAVAIWDNRPDIRVRLAGIAMGRREWADAERHLFRALEIRPGDPAALAMLGEVFAKTGRQDESREFVAEAGRHKRDGT
jgi:tetratricopeptide (TPR) repeat protein